MLFLCLGHDTLGRTAFLFVIGSHFHQMRIPFLDAFHQIFKTLFQIGIDKDTIKIPSLLTATKSRVITLSQET